MAITVDCTYRRIILGQWTNWSFGVWHFGGWDLHIGMTRIFLSWHNPNSNKINWHLMNEAMVWLLYCFEQADRSRRPSATSQLAHALSNFGCFPPKKKSKIMFIIHLKKQHQGGNNRKQTPQRKERKKGRYGPPWATTPGLQLVQTW